MNFNNFFRALSKAITVTVALLLSGSVFGASFTISNVATANAGIITTAELQSYADSFQTEVNSSLNIPTQKDFLGAMANANNAATKGLGVDYASNPSLFVVGFGAGAAANLGNNSISALDNVNFDSGLPGIGAAIQVSLMGGFNIGTILSEVPILKDSIIYAHFMTYGLPDSVSDQLSLRTTNIGANLQYKFIKPIAVVPFGVLKWGGLDLTGGLEYNRFRITYKQGVKETHSIGTYTSGATTYNMSGTFDGTGELGVTASTVTIPLEVSTNVQLLYVLSLFVGAGLDFSVGSGSSQANVSGPITFTGSGTTLGSANAKLDLGDSAGPSFGDLRFFAGPQLNLWVLKIFGQFNYSVSNSYGGVFGLRVAF